MKSNKIKPEDIIGLEAKLAYSKLFPYIDGLKAIALICYPQPPSIQERGELTESELKIAEEVAIIRKSLWFSYLEILLERVVKNNYVSKGLLNSINYHQEHPKSRKWVNIKELKSNNFIEIEKYCRKSTQLALCSRVATESNIPMHIPLLDFHVEKTPFSLDMVIKITKILFGDEFIVLATNRSFHSIGLTLVDDHRFKYILSNSLLFTPIIDNAYVAHQLMETEATLRIGKDSLNNKSPWVVAYAYKNGVVSEPDLLYKY